MPVSIAMFWTATRLAGTTTLCGRKPNRAPATEILQLPAASAILYRPFASVRTDRLDVPRVNLTTTLFAGAEHGNPATQTGVVGAFVTRPRRPLVDAPAEHASASTRAMSTPITLMRAWYSERSNPKAQLLLVRASRRDSIPRAAAVGEHP